MTTPIATRPTMKNYGISEGDEGMIAWEWVDEQMTKARNYWVSSTRPDGRPHAAPVWGVWLDSVLYFASARSSVKARNLIANPAVVIHLESGDDTVILEGQVEEVTDLEVYKRMWQVYGEKYSFPEAVTPEPDPNNITFSFKPTVALAWIEHDFPKTATRWTLG